MRIRTDGEYDWRSDLYDRTAEGFGVGTKSGGIDAACGFSTQMLRNPRSTGNNHVAVVTMKMRTMSVC